MPPADDPHAALTRTMPCADLSATAAAATPPAPAPAEPPPAFADDGIAVRLARAGLPPAGDERRYVVAGMLGAGATGQVYALVDRDLDRPVAVKVLARRDAEDVRSFIEEARITASLSHPNVLPLHELDVDPDGRVFFTMKQIDGRSLAAAIDASAVRRAPPLDDVNALVNVFIGVCQALAYAHHRRIVHQDVKPANIMLGAFGEVLLVDWGSACRLAGDAKPRIYGTPLYMSPEQARGERVDASSDVYCVGASLFHALFLRAPTWHDEPERFFALKRAGDIQPPSAEERARVPAALVDIALTAMRPRAEDRYADADALLADLRAFQGGLAVRAHRESLGERLARWHRRHRATLWPAVAALAVVATLAGALWGERLARIATWGAPVVAEDFTDDGWKRDWRVVEGSFERRDGRMVSTAAGRNLLLLDRKLRGDVAIEYDGEIPVGMHAADLSLAWSRGVKRGADGAITAMAGEYYAQFGACDGYFSALSTMNSTFVTNYRRPEIGRRYHVRVEIVGDELAMTVDGERLWQWTDEDGFDGGYVALMTFGPGKEFSHVRVCARGVPERVPATASGDALLRDGRLDAAVDAYEAVVESRPHAAVADEARYKAGRCRWRQGRTADAEAAWAPIADPSWRDLARLERVDGAFAAGDHERVLAELDDLGAAGATIRDRAGQRWFRCCERLLADDEVELLERYLALHDRRFADLAALDGEAGKVLMHLGRPDEAYRRYPRLPQVAISALAMLGHADVAVERFADMSFWRDLARYLGGMGDQIAPGSVLYGSSLAHRGLAEQALAAAGDDAGLAIFALAQLGRLDEAAARAQRVDSYQRTVVRILRGEPIPDADAVDREAHVLALLAAGDDAAAYALAPRGSEQRWIAGFGLAIAAWRAGDDARAAALATMPLRLSATASVAFAGESIAPFARALRSGDWDAFDAALRGLLPARFGAQQRPWFDARYLLGEIDDAAFVAQPHAAYAATHLLTRRAMRRERLGDRAGALADWRAWLELPRWRRAFPVDVPLERLAAWRIADLSR